MVYATSGRRERCGQKNAWHSVAERGTRMCVIAAFFARALRVCTGRACMSFFLILQEVRPICKTRNQFNKRNNLMLIHGHCHDQITAQRQRTHDKGSVTEEPCAGKLASTVLKQR